MFCVSNHMIEDNSSLDPLERCHLHQEGESALVRSKLSRRVCAHLSAALMWNRDDSSLKQLKRWKVDVALNGTLAGLAKRCIMSNTANVTDRSEPAARVASMASGLCVNHSGPLRSAGYACRMVTVWNMCRSPTAFNLPSSSPLCSSMSSQEDVRPCRVRLLERTVRPGTLAVRRGAGMSRRL